MKSFKETEEYLYSRLPMYQRAGKAAFKKDLYNIKELCWHLRLPHWKFKSIHVGGTNGKGSVSSMLASILMEAGFKVGLYTSPHLQDFTERIRINGHKIPEKEVVNFVTKTEKLIEMVQPSFFELTVAMAFDYFALADVDIAVIEVGLGGRLDSTNIIKPETSIITNISMDHQAMLGNSIGEIAFEKAGIIKSFTPVVIGETHPESKEVFINTANEEEAPIEFADQNFEITRISDTLMEQTFEVQDLQEEDSEPFTINLGLAGHYQAKNLGTVLQAIKALQEFDWEIEDEHVRQGLEKVRENSGLDGRMQVIQKKPYVLCDTAHNEAGVKEVMDQLTQMPYQNLHIIWGMVTDKDHDPILALLPKDATYYFVKPNVPRGLDEKVLQEKAAKHGLTGHVYPSVHEGMVAMILATQPEDLGFVGGSTFVVGEAI